MYYLLEDKDDSIRIIDSFDNMSGLIKHIRNAEEIINSNKCKNIDDVINILVEGMYLVHGVLSFGDGTVLIDSSYIENDVRNDVIRKALYEKYKSKIRESIINKLINET